MNKIDLWTRRGISYEEVVKRLDERTMSECSVACTICGFLGEPAGLKLAQMADELRSTQAILKIMEPIMRKQCGFRGGLLTQTLELHALAIEGYVRAAKECFPDKEHGNN